MMGVMRMTMFGTVFGRRRGLREDADKGEPAGKAQQDEPVVFASVRTRQDRVPGDPHAPTSPAPEAPADPAVLIARHLQADCFHFVPPGAAGPRD